MKTTVNGKEVSLLGKSDISRIFTSKVAEFLADEFSFYFYGGSQGEEFKVSLTNDDGKTVYIIYVHKELECFGDKWSERADTISVTCEKFVDVYDGKTLWLGRGDVIFNVKWYEISDRKGKYVDNIEDYIAIENIRNERWSRRHELADARNETELSENVRKKALAVIRKMKGYKSVKASDFRIFHRFDDAVYLVRFGHESKRNDFTIRLCA